MVTITIITIVIQTIIIELWEKDLYYIGVFQMYKPFFTVQFPTSIRECEFRLLVRLSRKRKGWKKESREGERGSEDEKKKTIGKVSLGFVA